MGDGVATPDVVLAVAVVGKVVLDTVEAVVDERAVVEVVDEHAYPLGATASYIRWATKIT